MGGAVAKRGIPCYAGTRADGLDGRILWRKPAHVVKLSEAGNRARHATAKTRLPKSMLRSP